ncbi:efflux RND transporter periplasmic adaptor subunit [Photobacterium sp. SDRW27]|uniref:efflux RND transporter periplasmic adaptor subunit n=1 Tax=Photobacterium obscurum TaxID=2829490 RepID=UPI002243FCAA|nr:efflux RND transporter periplasmic adaptor subunit [Photobacterium obscurum]MCW8328959.1 efflux RND transporter periplasmic adaptor subunit [Photobacterium obscurum]
MKKNLLALGVISALVCQPVWAVDLIGHTKSKHPLNVVSEISGKVESAAIETGERVALGAILASVKAQDFELEVRTQKANLELAKADLKIKQSLYERYQELRKKNSLSQNELDIAETDYDSAKATVTLAQIELKKAKLDLENTRINASIEGYVVNRAVESGTWVNQGDLLYQIVNIDRLNVRLLASEFDIGELHVGQAIEVWSEANPQHKVRSTIKRIGVEIDPQSVAYPVEVEIDNLQHLFKPGMSIHATTSIAPSTEVKS